MIGVMSIGPLRRRLGLPFGLYPKNISQEEVYDFLWYLLPHLRGHFIAIWDGASIHDPQGLRDVRRKYLRPRLEQLPPTPRSSICSKPPAAPPIILWPAARPTISTNSVVHCCTASARPVPRSEYFAAASDNPKLPYCDLSIALFKRQSIESCRQFILVRDAPEEKGAESDMDHRPVPTSSIELIC